MPCDPETGDWADFGKFDKNVMLCPDWAAASELTSGAHPYDLETHTSALGRLWRKSTKT